VGFPEGVRVVGGFIGAVVGVVEGDAVGLTNLNNYRS
jgi:hypothetical protein